jgi:hypothetical protein
VAAEVRGDPLEGTASPVSRWLLVEQPGPWGYNALLDSRLSRKVAVRLAEHAAVRGIRVVLIRRPGRGMSADRRRWAYVDSRPGREGVWWGSYDADEELLDVALEPPPTEPSPDPVYLVCAHGRHDTCCALRGRPVAAALAVSRPAETWECSHVGGDRFAANLVLLPHGFYYGQVPPGGATEVVAAYEAGMVLPSWLRGRSSLSGPVQAAQHHARWALEAHLIGDLAPMGAEQTSPGEWQVRLRHPSEGEVVVTVAAERTTQPVRLTCAARRPGTVVVYRLLNIRAGAED